MEDIETEILTVNARMKAVEDVTIKYLSGMKQEISNLRSEVFGEIQRVKETSQENFNELSDEIQRVKENSEQNLNELSNEVQRVKENSQQNLNGLGDQLNQKIDSYSDKLEKKKTTFASTSTPTNSKVRRFSSFLSDPDNNSSTFQTPTTIQDIEDSNVVELIRPFVKPISSREKLNKIQSAFFFATLDKLEKRDMTVDLKAHKIIKDGISNGIWSRDFVPEGKSGDFLSYMKEKIRGFIKAKKQAEIEKEASRSLQERLNNAEK